jgi:hypothetical protein
MDHPFFSPWNSLDKKNCTILQTGIYSVNNQFLIISIRFNATSSQSDILSIQLCDPVRDELHLSPSEMVWLMSFWVIAILSSVILNLTNYPRMIIYSLHIQRDISTDHWNTHLCSILGYWQQSSLAEFNLRYFSMKIDINSSIHPFNHISVKFTCLQLKSLSNLASKSSKFSKTGRPFDNNIQRNIQLSICSIRVFFES